MLGNHLPALVIIIPLFSAIFALLCRNDFRLNLLIKIAAILQFILAGNLLAEVFQTGEQFYAYGDWWVPIGIGFRVDNLSAIMIWLNSITFVIAALNYHFLIQDLTPGSRQGAVSLLFLCLAGLTGIAASDDLFNIYVFLEISSLASYGLLGIDSQKASPFVAFSYLILGTLGATLYLVGVGIFYSVSGSLNASDLATIMPKYWDYNIVKLGGATMLIGIMIKAAILPFAKWLVVIYNHTPSLARIVIAGASTKIGLYLLVRFVTFYWPAEFDFFNIEVTEIIGFLGILAIIYGSYRSYYADRIGTLLGYSSITNIGYVALMVGVDSSIGMAAAIINIFSHGITKAGLFLYQGYLANIYKLTRISELGRHLETKISLSFKFGFIILLFSLAGLPGTIGFIGKWQVIKALLHFSNPFYLLVFLLSSIVTVLYSARLIIRLFELAYNAQPGNTTVKLGRINYGLLLPILFVIILGVNTTFSLELAKIAASQIWN